MIFNRHAFCLHQLRANAKLTTSPFIEYAKSDIQSRLELLARNFSSTLDIRELDEETLNFSQGQFDLIKYCLGLHFINGVENFLVKVREYLLENGLFIANFVGGSSLRNLRLKLIQVEDQAGRPYSVHIVPFIIFDQLPALLYQAGFKEVVTDYETIKLQYKSPLALMKDLNQYGQSSCLYAMSKYGISKKMLELLSDESEVFTDEVVLISFIASKNKNGIKVKS